MELIVLSRRRRIQRAMHIGGGVLTLFGILGVAMLAGAVWLGAQLGGGTRFQVNPDPRPDLYVAAMRKELADLRARMQDTTTAARHDLDALALRLSGLQAQAIRIDALGGRLVELAGLDGAEFSFGEPAPQGGPAPSGSEEPNRVVDFVEALASLEQVLELRSLELEALENDLLSGRLEQQARPAGSPVISGWISSTFGPRIDPITGVRSTHFGVDFAGKRGSPVQAVAAGIISFSGTRTGLGRVVEIDHGNGYVTRYAHNMKNLVAIGDRVAKGQQIAKMGSTGRSTGTHVHFEVLLEGKPLNPIKFIRQAQAGS